MTEYDDDKDEGDDSDEDEDDDSCGSFTLKSIQ
jgi:hypothetical protein